MKILPVIVFKTPFYSPSEKTFTNNKQLQDFLTKFSFMRPHDESSWQIGLPEFRLGTRFDCKIEGVMRSSIVKWGPRIVVAQSVRMCDGKIYATVPMDSPNKQSKMVTREMREVKINKGTFDAVVDANLKQLWPKCEKNRSELVKFFTAVNKQKLF